MRPGPPRGAWLGPALALALLLLACFAAFQPALDAGLVDFDDADMLAALHALHAQPGGPAGRIAWAFTTFDFGHWQPLSWLSLAADEALWGPGPAGHHRTNLLLHALNAALVLGLARTLLRRALPALAPGVLTAGALLAALAFAVHPLRVESVAWIAERRDVLCGAFWLTAVWRYLVVLRVDVLVVAATTLSLLCKAWGLSLPLVFVAIDLGLARRSGLAALLRGKLAVIVPCLAAAALAGWAQHAAGVSRAWEQHGLAQRAAQAAYGLVFYVWKTLVPTGLSPLHPLRAPLDPLEGRFVLAGAVVLAAAAAAWSARRRAPALVAALACYALVLAPVLGFTQAGPQLVAERYSYLACLPFALLAAGGLARVARERPLVPLLAAGLLAAAAVPATRAQTRVWRDPVALWTSAVAVHPDHYFARFQLGRALFLQARDAEALAQLQVALADLPPDRAGRVAIMQTAAAVLGNLDRLDEAFALWDEVLRLDPDNLLVRIDAGLAHALRRDYAAAATHWRHALAVADQAPRTELERTALARARDLLAQAEAEIAAGR